jgi:peptidoglycan/xylan/chitin deacetylase (PgdA/CDA1 family)
MHIPRIAVPLALIAASASMASEPAPVEPKAESREPKAEHADRSVSISGHALRFPAAAHSGSLRLPVTAVVSADSKVLLATLIARGWSLHLHLGGSSRDEPVFRLGGRTPDVEFEHSSTRIDERLRLYLWRRKERLRDKQLWVLATAKVSGVRPLQPPEHPPQPAVDARDRLLADLSFALSQARPVEAHGAPGPRVIWSELAAAPEGAEELVPEPEDLTGANAPHLAEIARTAAADAGPPPAAPLLAAQAAPSPGPLHLAVIDDKVQTEVQGLHKLEPLPAPRPVPAVAISRPERAGKRVALTFDACSTLDRSFYDERVMHVLRDTRTPATLFISGRWAETHQDLVKQLAGNPLFEIANHSYIHPHMLEVPRERQEHELLWTQQILFTLTGRLPRFFRPPYGEMNDGLVKVAAELGIRTVEYDFPSGDPDKQVTRERMVKWVLQKARPGSIVVMHMNRHGWHTGEALPDIIEGLRARGFELARVGDLVDADEAAAGAQQ